MKRLIYLLFLLLISIIIFPSCTSIKYKVNIHYKDNVDTITVGENSSIDFSYTYDDDIFLGWFDETLTIELTNQSITSDIDIYAKTTERGVQYKITYILDGGEFNGSHPIKYYSGETTQLVNPTKKDNYEFVGWLLDNKPITEIGDTMYGNITLTATWKDVANYYSITLNLDGGTMPTNLQDKYRANSTIKLDYPTKDNSYFRGWYSDSTYSTKVNADQTITSDLSLYAKFETKSPENTYISFLGDSITTFAGYLPEGYIEYYPAGDVTTVNDTWWYQVVENTGYNLLVNDSYSGTQVTSGTSYGSSLERIKLLQTNDYTPDIVIIHMGTNDFTHGININSFKEAYINMIELIKEYYDDVIIYVCTLPYNTYNESFIEPRLKQNEVIKEIASTYNLKLLSLETVLTEQNCRDLIYAGSHPNKKGMKAIADYVTNELKGLN